MVFHSWPPRTRTKEGRQVTVLWAQCYPGPGLLDCHLLRKAAAVSSCPELRGSHQMWALLSPALRLPRPLLSPAVRGGLVTCFGSGNMSGEIRPFWVDTSGAATTHKAEQEHGELKACRPSSSATLARRVHAGPPAGKNHQWAEGSAPWPGLPWQHSGQINNKQAWKDWAPNLCVLCVSR